MSDLQEIDGVGPSYAEELASNGYEDAEAVAAADPEEVDAVVDTLDGEAVVSGAEAVAGADADTSDSDDAEAASFELAPGFDDDQRNHLLRALVEQEVQARRRNDPGRAEAIRGAVQQIVDGEPYEFTMQQLDAAYTGVNQLEAEYRGTRGLGAFTTKIREVRDTFKQARQDNWD